MSLSITRKETNHAPCLSQGVYVPFFGTQGVGHIVASRAPLAPGLLDGPHRPGLAGIRAFRFSVPGCPCGDFPKKLLVLAQCINLTTTVAFTVILILDLEKVWLIYFAALLTGSAWSIDFPIRRAFIRDMLPLNAIVNAMAIDAASLVGMAMAACGALLGILADLLLAEDTLDHSITLSS